MKKHIFLFSLLLTLFAVCFPVTSTAQQPGDEYAIFNWRNDGDFSAFLNCDVDSITYSKVDLEGRTHHNAVVQVVWTPDSVYRIPIAAIDSVALRAPEPILKDGIFHITEWHFPYVTGVNDSTALTVTFNASIPADSLPSVGQVVITDVYDGLLERGFAGRVIRIVNSGTSVLIECEEVALDDIYDLLVCVGKSESFIDDDSPAGAPKRIHYEEEDVLSFKIAKWNTTISDFEDEDGSGNIELTVIPSIILDYAICYNVKGKQNHFKCVVSPTLDCDFDSNWKLSKSASFPKRPKEFVFVKIPTKVPGLVAKVGASYFLDFSGSAELNVNIPLRIQANAGYDSWREDPFFVNFYGTGIRSINGVSDGNFQIKLDGSVYTGLSLNFTVFFLHENIANAKIGLKAGPKFSATIDFSNDMTHAPSWYDFKDTKVSVEPLVAQMTASVETLFTDKLPWSSPQASIFGQKNYYLFPQFSAPHLNAIGSGLSLTALTTDISRNLIFKVTPGIGLYQNGELKQSYFSDSTYKRQDKWNLRYLKMELLNNCPLGTYTAKPIFKFFNSTVEASPTSSVTIPDTLKVENTVNVKVDETQTITFTGGWGDYNISNNASSICTASITGKNINITGRKNGTALLTLTDKRSGESKIINVIVYETPMPPTISVTPAEYNFGTVIKGNSVQKTFTVTGTYLTGNLTLTSNSSDFTVSPASITKADAANGVTVTVTYSPSAAGSHSGTITISGGGAISKTVSLSGTCVAPSFSAHPAVLELDTVVTGNSATATFIIRGSDLTGNLSLISNNDYFTVSPATITPQQAADGTIVTVTYRPSVAGSHSAEITISGGGAGYKKVHLSGTAVNPPPVINVSPSALAFGTVIKGNSVQKTFTVTGTYLTGNLTLTSSSSNFTVSPESITKADAANGVTVTVTYNPSAAGSHSGTITINGGGATSKTVSLSGTCVVPSFTAQPAVLDFGSVVKGNSATATFIVRGSNLTGNLSLISNNNYFTVSPATITPQQAADGTIVTVTYSPSVAGSHSAEIAISGGGAAYRTVSLSGECVVPYISTSATSLAFGTVVKGNSAKKTFTVTGTYLTGNLTVSSNNSNFTVSPTTITKANAANGVTVTVTYSPSAAGSHSGTITISGGGASSKTVSLSGTAVNPTPVISVSPTSLAFGTVVKGKTVQKTFTVTGSDLTGNLTVSSNNSNFTVSPTSITKANAANGVTVTVTYNPSAAGSHSGTITISGGGATSKTVSLSGTCVVPSFTAQPAVLDFGSVVTGNSATATFIIRGSNLTGNLSLISNNNYFTVSPATITPQQAADGKTVTVTYKPTIAGSHSAEIAISGGGAAYRTVSLSGTAVNPTPVISVSPTSLAFGTVVKGKTVQKTFTVTGTNLTGNLTVSSNNSNFTVSPTSITKANAANGVTVTVTYNPSAAGSHSGTITISGGGATSKTVSLSGTCVVPSFTARPAVLDFDIVAIGKSATETFIVRGTDLTGNLSLVSNHNYFTVSPATITPQQAADGKTVTVTYKPTAYGTHNGTITISGGGAGYKTVTLYGECQ